jgi:hypothetical protein
MPVFHVNSVENGFEDNLGEIVAVFDAFSG